MELYSLLIEQADARPADTGHISLMPPGAMVSNKQLKNDQ